MSMAALPPVSRHGGGAGPLVIMGVSGCGKSSVGAQLADRLGFTFVEGDSLHSASNVAKMAAGIALDDADRSPWLDALGNLIAAHPDDNVVLSCSALRRVYRDRLRSSARGQMTFVFLRGSRAALHARLVQRQNHYMPATLLDSQLAALESPVGEPDVVTIDVEQSVDTIVALVLAALANDTLKPSRVIAP